MNNALLMYPGLKGEPLNTQHTDFHEKGRPSMGGQGEFIWNAEPGDNTRNKQQRMFLGMPYQYLLNDDWIQNKALDDNPFNSKHDAFGSNYIQGFDPMFQLKMYDGESAFRN